MSSAPGRPADLLARWGRVRARAASVDWPRVERMTLPIAALLLAGLIGFAVGHGASQPASPPRRVASATRAWRSATPGTTTAFPAAGETTRPGAAPPAPPGPGVAAPGHPIRFRDFRITASSWELSNPPILATDGDPYTAWHAWETERFRTGDWLTLTFSTPRVVSRIGLIPGRVGPRARQDGRVRSILVKAPGAAPQKLVFADRPGLQYRDLKQPVLTRKLILRILTVLPGTRSSHIVVPEVQVWGHPAPSQVAARG